MEAKVSHSLKVKSVSNDSIARYAVFLGLQELMIAAQPVTEESKLYAAYFNTHQRLEE